MLYNIVEGAIGVTELHATYEERASKPKPARTRRRYLSTLVEKYGILETPQLGTVSRFRIQRR
ncbi:hypothetical protein G6M89_10440 [Natronolimnobius sp. AArcel1]|uniref:hypothetical protein n=1 Tax=Natronolimnobius sp. AArcel1 TaxID=1679093 RepID=UPI0013EBFF6E|nr:hypothetical protein [Natronolimnobius sp. AArcel1]NGM69421.1 hypothetical protein [Natronolimnobius sp. AArcel1]